MHTQCEFIEKVLFSFHFNTKTQSTIWFYMTIHVLYIIIRPIINVLS